MATAAKKDDAPAKPEGTHVKYTGLSHVRRISAADWKGIGIEDQQLVVWDKDNDWSVPVEELSEKALEYCIKRDNELTLVTIEK